MPVNLDIRDKPYLRLQEAAHLACLSVSKFRQVARELQIPALPWSGVTVYRRSDILAAMEESWLQSGVASAGALNTGTYTGEVTDDCRVARLEAQQRSQKVKRESRSRPKKSNSAEVHAISDRPRSPTGP